jgi:Terminase large subunit, ATPase domain
VAKALNEVDRFAEFFSMLGYRLEDFQREIVAEAFSARRELLVLVPRANGKSTLLAAIALWSLLRGKGSQIVVGAASREQASVLFDIAREMARHPEIAPLVEVTRREVRTQDGWLKVIAADGPRQHGLIVDLAIVDELHAHRHDELYIALRTSLQKRPGARMIAISTGGARIETPLGRLRDRGLKLPKVRRDGAFTRAEGEHLAMLACEGYDPGRRLRADRATCRRRSARPPVPRTRPPVTPVAQMWSNARNSSQPMIAEPLALREGQRLADPVSRRPHLAAVYRFSKVQRRFHAYEGDQR